MHFSIITSRSLQKHASLTVLFGDDGRISDGRWCKERCKDVEKRKVFNKMEVSQMFRKLSVVKHYSFPVDNPTY